MGTFSLGMNQRLGIAGDPETVILDEPVNGLDPDGILWIRNLMKSLASEGRTVFLSSHLMSEMAQTADPCSSSVGVGSPPTPPPPLPRDLGVLDGHDPVHLHRHARQRLVLAAKAGTAATLVFPVALLCNVAGFELGQRVLAGKHLQVALSHPGVLQAIVFGAVAVSLVAIGVGLGGVIRHTAGSNTALALLIVGGVTLGQLLPAALRQYLPGTAIQAAVTVHRTAGLPKPGAAIAVLGAYATIALAAALMRIAHGDS